MPMLLSNLLLKVVVVELIILREEAFHLERRKRIDLPVPVPRDSREYRQLSTVDANGAITTRKTISPIKESV